MTNKLTFEERLSRLERLMKSRTPKNEFRGLFDKPKRKEEKSWLDTLFKKYPSLWSIILMTFPGEVSVI